MNNIKIALTLLSILFTVNLSAQGDHVFDWTHSNGGISPTIGESIATDAQGNVYTVGTFSGTLDLDPTSGLDLHISAGGDDVFIQKLTASGNFVWAKSFGGKANEVVKSICIDTSGYIYTTGQFTDTVDLDPSSSIDLHTENGGRFSFIQKLDTSGNFVWAKSFGGLGVSDRVYATASVVDFKGNVYTTGYFRDTIDFDPDTSLTTIDNHVSTKDDNAFVQKLDATGSFVWAKSFGGKYYTRGESIAIDGQGSIYSAGIFEDTTNLNPSGQPDNHISLGSSDFFIQKLDASGNFKWGKSFGGIDEQYDIFIAADFRGNIYTTGVFEDPIDLDPSAVIDNHISAGGGDVFIQKLDTLGSFKWAKSFGGVGNEGSVSLVIDSFGAIYTIGNFNRTADFDPSVGTDIHTPLSFLGYGFIQKLDEMGGFVWAKSFGGTGSSQVFSNSAAINFSGNIYTTGNFSGTIDFDPSLTGINNHASAGSIDAFVQKFQFCNIDTSTTISGLKLTANQTGVVYQWIDCGNNNSLIANATGRSYTVTANGDYAVVLTNGICVDTSACVNINSVGIEESNSVNGITLYPNPFNDNINVSITKLANNSSISVLDVLGKEVYWVEITSPTTVVQLEKEAKGVYFVQIQNGAQLTTQKVIKH